jgi:hypothetical protein
MRILFAGAIAAFGFCAAAEAATFSVSGGDSFWLPGDFDPAGGSADVAPGVGMNRNGTLILDKAGKVSFTYAGTEAGYQNKFWAGGLEGFDNKAWSNASFSLKLDAGVVPFSFGTVSPAGTVANGASSGYYQSISLFQKSPTTVFALFNDSATSDTDFDDMVVRMDVAPVPLAAAAWLLIGGLGGLGAVARRKSKSKATA